MKDINEIIDLTYPIEEEMLTFNAHWHTKVKIRQMGSIDKEGRETRELTLGTHTGTHMDAPLHFVKNGNSIDTLSLDKLIGDVNIIDFSFLEKCESVSVKLLKQTELSKKVIFRFGWGKYWNTPNFYKDYPFFTEESAEYIVSKGVELIGMDTPSPDDSRTKLGSKDDSKIHKIFLKGNLILLEYLANLDTINELEGWKIIALPLKIKGSDGSPARVCLYR